VLQKKLVDNAEPAKLLLVMMKTDFVAVAVARAGKNNKILKIDAIIGILSKLT